MIGHRLTVESVQAMTGACWRNSSLERWRAMKWAPVWYSGAPCVERLLPRRTTCWTTSKESTSPTLFVTTAPTAPRLWPPRTPSQSMCTPPTSSNSPNPWFSKIVLACPEASPSPPYLCHLFLCLRCPRPNREKKPSSQEFLLTHVQYFKNIDNLLPGSLKHNLKQSGSLLLESLILSTVQEMTGVSWRDTLCEM